MNEDVEMLLHAGRDSKLRQWLERERATKYKYLAQADNPVTLHRAQGEVLLIERMLVLLEKARQQQTQ